MSGNDGRHPNVVSKVTVEFLVFTNSTIENSVTLQVTKLSSRDFLGQYYRALLDVLQEEVDVGDTLKIFSLGETGSDLNIHVAVESPEGILHCVTVFDRARTMKRLQDSKIDKFKCKRLNFIAQDTAANTKSPNC